MNKKYNKRLSGFLALVMMLSVILVGMPEVVRAEEYIGPELIITEICYNQSNEAPFIEIYNTTDNAIDLSNYFIYRSTSKGVNKAIDFNNETIAARSTFVIALKTMDLANFNLKYNTNIDESSYLSIAGGTWGRSGTVAISTVEITNKDGLKSSSICYGDYTEMDLDKSIHYVYPESGNGMIQFEGVSDSTPGEVDSQQVPSTSGGDPVEPIKVANVTATPKPGTVRKGTEVILQTSTEGATVYYTIDGTDPTTDSDEYSDPIIINESTTIKAIAVKEGLDNSDTSTFEYTTVELMDIAGTRGKAVGDYVWVQGIVTFVDGGNNYIQDETAGIDVFIFNAGLEVGDKIDVFGKIADFNGLVEIAPDSGKDVKKLSSGNELPAPKTVTIDQVNTDAYQGQLVKIENVTIGAINTGGNTLITDENGNKINIFKIPTLTGIAEGDKVNVIAIASIYNTPQLRVRSASDITKVEEEEPTPEDPVNPDPKYPVLIQEATKTEDKLEVKLYNFEEDMNGIVIIKVLDENGKPYIIDYKDIMNITKGENTVYFTLDSAKYTRGISGVKVYVWKSFKIMKPFARQKTFDL